MGDVRSNFIQRLARQFPLPKQAANDLPAWEADYVEALSFYSDTVLEFAAKKLIFAERQHKSFPMPAECLKACKEAHGEFSAPAPKRVNRDDEWSPEAFKEADRLLCSDIGRRAADEGWAWQLWDFMRRQRRWPNAHEASHLKAHSIAMNKETTEFIAAEEKLNRIIPATRKWLGKMSARRKELREIAYGNHDKNQDDRTV